MGARVLLIDDNVGVLRALDRLLRRAGYEVRTARSGDEALVQVRAHEVAVIVCDYSMPGRSGTSVLAECARLQPRAVRIMLTGQVDAAIARAAINEGRVSRFLLKPWEDDTLRATVAAAAREYETECELQRLHELTQRQRNELVRWNAQLTERVAERTAALADAYEQTLDALVLALDARENATAGHSRRVALYCLFLALELNVPPDRLEHLYRGAVLHDIGKIGVPDAVLLKPGPLDAAERAVMEQHVVLASQLLGPIPHLRPALPIPRYHHERWDGTGYAAGLAAEAIPAEARIFAVVDVYDALRCSRPYKGPMPHPQACALITAEAGRHFDPRAAERFLTLPADTWVSLATHAETVRRFAHALRVCQHLKERATRGALA